MLIKRIMIAASLAALCAGGNALAADKAGYEKALAAAKTEQKAAAAAGGEWRDMGKMLKKAAAAAKKGDYATATKLAETVAFQGKMGQQQAKGQMNVGNPAYLYK